MPRPKSQENKNDFMKRCIPEVMHEGRENKAAVAKCFGIWGTHNKIGDTSEQEYRRKHKKSYEVNDESKSYQIDEETETNRDHNKKSYGENNYGYDRDHNDGKNNIDGKNSYNTYDNYEYDRNRKDGKNHKDKKHYDTYDKDKKHYDTYDNYGSDHKDKKHYDNYGADHKDKKVLNKDDKIRLYVLHY